MGKLRSDKATEASWGFLENAELMEALTRQAQRQPKIDWEDVLQEVILWLAVRPELHDLSIPFILRNTRSRVKTLVDSAKYREVEVPFEEQVDHE